MSRLTSLLLALSIAGHAHTMIKQRTILTDSHSPENVKSRSDIEEILYKKGSLRKKENSTGSIPDIAN